MNEESNGTFARLYWIDIMICKQLVLSEIMDYAEKRDMKYLLGCKVMSFHSAHGDNPGTQLTSGGGMG